MSRNPRKQDNSIRKSIIQLIQRTKVINYRLETEAEVTALANRMGITVELFQEARETANRIQYDFFRADIPKQVKAHLRERILQEHGFRQLAGFIRAVCYPYIVQNEWDPVFFPKWELEGEVHFVTAEDKTPTRMPVIFVKAWIARAEKLGMKPPTLFRSLMMSYLTGTYPFVIRAVGIQLFAKEEIYE